MANEKETQGKPYRAKWKKYLVWYLILGVIAYILIWYFFLRGGY